MPRRANSWTPGIDVSMYQCNIDWSAVARSARFVFIKATEGAQFIDPFFAFNWQAARSAGIIRGAYHFFRPQEPVAEQVKNFVSTVRSLSVSDMPPVLDLEVPGEWSAIPIAQRITLVTDWLEGVEKALKVRPIVYLSPSFVKNVLGADNAAVLQKYKLWIANYTNAPQPIVPAPWTNWTFWQHSDQGTLPGITCNFVDLDWYAGSVSSLKALTVKKRRRRKRSI